jgi:phosphoglycerate-specific signal transduction histidine kinase
MIVCWFITSAADGFVEVSVLDHGVGLPQDNPDKIFSQFFSTKPNGMGMGLTITLDRGSQASCPMRRIAVCDLRDVTETSVIQMLDQRHDEARLLRAID